MKKMFRFLFANKPVGILAIISVIAGILAFIAVLVKNEINFQGILAAFIAGGFISIVIFIGVGSFLSFPKPDANDVGECLENGDYTEG
jgi:hypothetical protein